jgi:hypothetical protein
VSRALLPGHISSCSVSRTQCGKSATISGYG